MTAAVVTTIAAQPTRAKRMLADGFGRAGRGFGT